jgi:hypothetical protein
MTNVKPVILAPLPFVLLLGCFEKPPAAQPDIQGMVARQFHVDAGVVTVEYKPHDCEYEAAPIGKKYCGYIMHEDAKVNDFCLQAEYPKLSATRPYQQVRSCLMESLPHTSVGTRKKAGKSGTALTTLG